MGLASFNRMRQQKEQNKIKVQEVDLKEDKKDKKKSDKKVDDK